MAPCVRNISTALVTAFSASLFAVFTAGAITTESIDAGEEIASANCVRCHSIAKKGASTLAAAPPFRSFKSKWPLESLEEALAEGIMASHVMPEFTFDPDEIDDLLNFIDSLAPDANPNPGERPANP